MVPPLFATVSREPGAAGDTQVCRLAAEDKPTEVVFEKEFTGGMVDVYGAKVVTAAAFCKQECDKVAGDDEPSRLRRQATAMQVCRRLRGAICGTEDAAVTTWRQGDRPVEYSIQPVYAEVAGEPQISLAIFRGGKNLPTYPLKDGAVFHAPEEAADYLGRHVAAVAQPDERVIFNDQRANSVYLERRSEMMRDQDRQTQGRKFWGTRDAEAQEFYGTLEDRAEQVLTAANPDVKPAAGNALKLGSVSVYPWNGEHSSVQIVTGRGEEIAIAENVEGRDAFMIGVATHQAIAFANPKEPTGADIAFLRQNAQAVVERQYPLQNMFGYPSGTFGSEKEAGLPLIELSPGSPGLGSERHGISR